MEGTIKIDQELAAETYNIIVLNFNDLEADRLKQLEDFKKFIHKKYFRPEHLNGIFAGIHQLKQENLLNSWKYDKESKEGIEYAFEKNMIAMYWDCAILFKTMI